MDVSNRHLTPKQVLDHHKNVGRLIAKHYIELKSKLAKQKTTAQLLPEGFHDVEGYISTLTYELEVSTLFSLVSCLEAAIRLDALERVQNGKAPHSPVTIAYIAIMQNQFSGKIDKFVGHANIESLLDILSENETNANAERLRQLKRPLKLRHWIAHGRYYSLDSHSPYSGQFNIHQAKTDALKFAKAFGIPDAF